MRYPDLVLTERERQRSHGKSDNHSVLGWKLVVEDQLAMITRLVSLARYNGLRTMDTKLADDQTADIPLTADDRRAIQLGLVRLGACAMAWHQALEEEGP
jgi:hypothetical protein